VFLQSGRCSLYRSARIDDPQGFYSNSIFVQYMLYCILGF